MVWGIWNLGGAAQKGDWLREQRGDGIIAFTNRRTARARAAAEYGYTSYKKVRADGWCEVRPLIGRRSH